MAVRLVLILFRENNAITPFSNSPTTDGVLLPRALRRGTALALLPGRCFKRTQLIGRKVAERKPGAMRLRAC
jgi:hypothetical protein